MLRPPKPLRVLLVAHNLGLEARAGTESYVLQLGHALVRKGVEVTFLAPKGPPTSGPKDPVAWERSRLGDLDFLQFTRINLDFTVSLCHPGFENAFRQMLHRQPVDLVHFHHTYLSSISLIEVALDLGLPVVLTLHDAWYLCPRLHCTKDGSFCGGPEDLKRCSHCLEDWLMPRTAATREVLFHCLRDRRDYVRRLFPRCRVLAPSRFLRDLYYRSGVAPGEIIHLPLGLDDLGLKAAPPEKNRPLFVFLGNLVPVKRVDLAVAAFAPLAGAAFLDIWGARFPELGKEFLESLAPYPHIRYRGPYRREDLPRLLAGAWATVVCSEFENCPLVVRESLSLGVPVIATRAGGLPELVRPGENGLLFPRGDAQALRRQVTRLLRRPELVNRLRQGLTPVKTLEAEAQELLDLYYSLLRKARVLAQETPEKSAPSRPAVQASIIIPTHNHLNLTRKCLESIEAHTPPGDFEIIVVDNGSSDGTPAYLKERQAAGFLTAILNPHNLGFAKACNQGARAAAGGFLVFLNNDTVVTPGWMQELCRLAREDPTLGAVGAKLLYPDDTVQHAGVVFNGSGKVYHIYRHLHKDHPAVNKEREFQVLTAACLLVKREAFFKVGLFDEDFVNGYEDVDLCLKLRQQGYRLLYNPRAVVYHLESQTAGRFDHEKENARRLSQRWREMIQPDDQVYYQQDGIKMTVYREPDGTTTAVMEDSNDNPFWAQARTLASQGRRPEALSCYLKALKFNPFDRRIAVIAEEMAELLEASGKFEEAAILRQHLLRTSGPPTFPRSVAGR